MKRKTLKSLISLGLVLITTLSFAACKTKDNKELKKVRLNEVVRSVFYAPMYAAINNGYFKDEGIDIELSTGQGADKTMQQVISGSADIGFCGPEQVIYIHNQKKDNLPIVFAQLTQKDGSFLVGRKENKDFKWSDLKGKTIIGGRPGGMPEMSLEYVLKNNGVENKKNVDIITNLAFTATAGAFKSGTGDYVALFEPTASMLEKDKSGYIVGSIGKSAGNMPYTSFFATESYIDKNSDLLEAFTRAIYKGQTWVLKTSNEEIAKAIESFFPGTDRDIIVNVIKNYKDIDAFSKTPVIKEEEMNRLMDIISSYDNTLIPNKPSFDKLVTNKFSEKVVK